VFHSHQLTAINWSTLHVWLIPPNPVDSECNILSQYSMMLNRNPLSR
jgi:hypothetical protein